ncbi:galaxin-like [Saccostrea echinata]|uniref:galaxin-like n=1 Tax=Saccostrea echinata TaxID=191078 RepID=UPI002A827AAB|nr:galaxin-like [Saccostrea echinata]
MVCCGDIQINKSTHFCCTNKPVLKSSGMDCCFDEPFNPTTHRCEDDRVIQVTEGLCGDTSYDVNSSMKCCDEKLHNTSEIEDPIECCGKELYSIFSQKCCKGTNFRAPRDEQCCGQVEFRDEKRECCR